jgi:hypothetical protein
MGEVIFIVIFWDTGVNRVSRICKDQVKKATPEASPAARLSATLQVFVE